MMQPDTPFTPALITPECYASECHHNGDQYTMIKCSTCGHWFCAEHIATNDTNDENGRRVTLVESGLRGISYYLGRCADCGERFAPRKRTDSAWLR